MDNWLTSVKDWEWSSQGRRHALESAMVKSGVSPVGSNRKYRWDLEISCPAAAAEAFAALLSQLKWFSGQIIYSRVYLVQKMLWPKPLNAITLLRGLSWPWLQWPFLWRRPWKSQHLSILIMWSVIMFVRYPNQKTSLPLNCTGTFILLSKLSQIVTNHQQCSSSRRMSAAVIHNNTTRIGVTWL